MINALIRDHVVERTAATPSDFLCNLFTVPKPDNSRRIIFDASFYTEFSVRPTFSLPSPRTVARALAKLPAGYAFKLDLKNGYYSVPLDPTTQFTFVHNNETFRFTKLPMGVSQAPWIFHRFLRPLDRHLRRSFPGLKVFRYLDDFLFWHPDEAFLRAIRSIIIKEIER